MNLVCRASFLLERLLFANSGQFRGKGPNMQVRAFNQIAGQSVNLKCGEKELLMQIDVNYTRVA